MDVLYFKWFGTYVRWFCQKQNQKNLGGGGCSPRVGCWWAQTVISYPNILMLVLKMIVSMRKLKIWSQKGRKLKGTVPNFGLFSIFSDFRFHIVTQLSPHAYRLCTWFLSKSDFGNTKKTYRADTSFGWPPGLCISNIIETS